MNDPYRMIIINLIASAFLLIGLYLYKKKYPKSKINLFILMLLISILPVISIFRPGSYESGDLSEHVKNAMPFFENIQQGNFLPRWMERHCSGYGCPVFVFSFLLSYYLISFIHFIGFSFIDSAKIVISLSFILSGVGMFKWINSEFGEKSAFISSIFYLFAPYHLIDLHFRVSIGEIVSMAILPFLFLTTKNLIEKKQYKFFLVTSILLALLVLSHQVAALASFPFLLLYGLYVWFRNNRNSIKKLIILGSSYVCGLLLSAFYWLPVLTESKYIIYEQATVTFRPLIELFYAPNKFGFLFQGHYGEIYTIIGYTQWFVIFLSLYILLKKKIKGKEKHMLLGSFICFLLLFLMMQSITKPLWLVIPVINKFEYAYRLSLEIIIVVSVMAAIVVKVYKNKYLYLLLCFITIAYTFLNWGNRKVLSQITDSFLYNQPILGNGTLIPVWVDQSKIPYGKIQKKHIEIISGSGEIKEISRLIIKHEYVISAKTPVAIKENTYYFPGWIVFIDNKEAQINYKNNKYPGIITFNADNGLHKIDLEFQDTPVRKISKYISFITLCLIILLMLFRKQKTEY